MKPPKVKTEIYSVSYLKEGFDGNPIRAFYMVGNVVPSYTGKPTKVLSIKLSFGVFTVSFEDGTSVSFGYEPKTTEIYRRKIDDGTTEENTDEI